MDKEVIPNQPLKNDNRPSRINTFISQDVVFFLQIIFQLLLLNLPKVLFIGNIMQVKEKLLNLKSS